MDGKGRGFLSMKGAETKISGTTFFQIDSFADDLYYICTLFYPCDNFLSRFLQNHFDIKVEGKEGSGILYYYNKSVDNNPR